MTALGALLDRHRLVVCVGAGGVGKTTVSAATRLSTTAASGAAAAAMLAASTPVSASTRSRGPATSTYAA